MRGGLRAEGGARGAALHSANRVPPARTTREWEEATWRRARRRVLALGGHQSECTTSAGPSEGGFERIEGVSRPAVALGKFNALHLGHRELICRASRMGHPCLLSFSGMSKILGRVSRPPLTATVDRDRVLRGWSDAMANGSQPKEVVIPFKDVRHLQPEDFVKVLVYEMGASGIVCGENYRFGYRAAGDASLLSELGAKHEIPVCVVDLVETPRGGGAPGAGGEEQGPRAISSSRISNLLAEGRMGAIAEMLGREYRLVVGCDDILRGARGGGGRSLSVPLESFRNLVPGPGTYPVSVVASGDERTTADCAGPGIAGTVRVGESDAILECSDDLDLEGEALLCMDFT